MTEILTKIPYSCGIRGFVYGNKLIKHILILLLNMVINKNGIKVKYIVTSIEFPYMI